MFILKGKRRLYHSALLFMVIVTITVVISGINLTAKRMSAIVPQLPAYAIRVGKGTDYIYFDILGQKLQVTLPGFLQGVEGTGGEDVESNE